MNGGAYALFAAPCQPESTTDLVYTNSILIRRNRRNVHMINCTFVSVYLVFTTFAVHKIIFVRQTSKILFYFRFMRPVPNPSYANE